MNRYFTVGSFTLLLTILFALHGCGTSETKDSMEETEATTKEEIAAEKEEAAEQLATTRGNADAAFDELEEKTADMEAVEAGNFDLDDDLDDISPEMGVSAEDNVDADISDDFEDTASDVDTSDDDFTFETETPDDLGDFSSTESGDFTTKTITFTSGTSWNKYEYSADLQAVADYLVANPGASMQIEGYTDTAGSESANDRLSMRRAEAVLNALVQDHSVDPSRLITIPYGEYNTIPGLDGRDPANRRVEIRLK